MLSSLYLFFPVTRHQKKSATSDIFQRSSKKLPETPKRFPNGAGAVRTPGLSYIHKICERNALPLRHNPFNYVYQGRFLNKSIKAVLVKDPPSLWITVLHDLRKLPRGQSRIRPSPISKLKPGFIACPLLARPSPNTQKRQATYTCSTLWSMKDIDCGVSNAIQSSLQEGHERRLLFLPQEHICIIAIKNMNSSKGLISSAVDNNTLQETPQATHQNQVHIRPP